MKRIINKSLYDTNTARCLGSASYNITDNLNHYYETLYLTKSGKYFLHGEGGPRTKYATATPTDGWKSGEKIVPMDPEAARQWAEENLPPDQYQAAFETAEDDQKVWAVLPPDLAAALKQRAKAERRTQSDLVGAAIRAYLENTTNN